MLHAQQGAEKAAKRPPVAKHPKPEAPEAGIERMRLCRLGDRRPRCDWVKKGRC